MRPRSSVTLVLLLSLLVWGWPWAAQAAVSVTRAELGGTELRLEGERAIADAPILVDGVQLGRSDDRGRFRIRVGGFASPSCRISVDDGTGAVGVPLSGCSPTVPTEPDPDPDPAPDPDPDPAPPPAVTPSLSGILLSPSTLPAGETATGTVLLSGPAPAEGVTVGMRSNATSVATVAPTVTIPAGGTAGAFAVSAQPVAVTSHAAISATFDGITRTATLTVQPAGVTLSTLGLAPTLLVGGEAAVGTVTLTGPAPDDGAVVSLSSSNTIRATVPGTVAVAAGETSASFPVTTFPVTSPASVSVTGSFGGVTRFASLTLTPASGVLAALAIDPDTVVGGAAAVGTVTLTGAPGTDTVVALASTTPTVATVPATVTVPAGQTSGTFPIATHPVSEGSFSWISATLGSYERGASINVNPGAPSTAPSISAVGVVPDRLGGGGTATGTVTLSRPAADGAIIELASSHPRLVDVPATAIVAAGASGTAFPLTTSAVAADTVVNVTATARCCGATGQRQGVVTVTTAPPPPPDVVTITHARLRRCILTVEATSTSADAIVTVHTAAGALLLRLTNLGGGRYAGERAWRPPGTNVPVELVVSSNLGGADTVSVSDPQASRCRADL
jgi:hypothetical protein